VKPREETLDTKAKTTARASKLKNATQASSILKPDEPTKPKKKKEKLETPKIAKKISYFAPTQFLHGDALKKLRRNQKKIHKMNLTNKVLDGILKANSQILGKNKSEKIEMVAHGMTFGKIPFCTWCNVGRAKFLPEKGQYACFGAYFEDVKINCRNTVSLEKM